MPRIVKLKFSKIIGGGGGTLSHLYLLFCKSVHLIKSFAWFIFQKLGADVMMYGSKLFAVNA